MEYWDTKAKVVLGGPSAKAVNSLIRGAETDLDRLFKGLQVLFDKVEPYMLKNVYYRRDPLHRKKTEESESPPTLLSYYDDFIARLEKQVEKKLRADGTLRQWRSNKRKVVRFLKHQYKKTDIDIKDITYRFPELFYDYLTLYLDQPLSEVTAKRQIKKARQIISIAVKRQIISSNPLSGFVCSGGEKEVLPLEYHQVLSIYSKKLTICRMDRIRDSFIVQCFTGFAYQDILNLGPDNIVLVGKNAERWLIKERGKTEVNEMVPILPVVEEIIEKYKNDPLCIRKKRLFPVCGNYHYNVYLKELADICGITRELNTHLARHTFADIILNAGVPIEDLQVMMGHKDIRTTLKYARVRKERISKDMRPVREQLFTVGGKLILEIS